MSLLFSATYPPEMSGTDDLVLYGWLVCRISLLLFQKFFSFMIFCMINNNDNMLF